MRLVGLNVGLGVAGLLIGALPGSAQYLDAPRPPVAIGSSVLNSAAEIVEAMGLDPVGPAIRSGSFLIQRATDDFGRVLRVTVDARRSQVVAVEAASQPRGSAGYAPQDPYASYRPYAGYGPYRGPYAAPGLDEGLAPPGSVMGSRAQQPHGALPPPHSASITPDLSTQPAAPVKPKARSAAVTPQHPQTAPTPRKRPSAAP